MFAKWDKGLLFKKLLIRVKYGCGWEPAELCVLPKIGKKRAEALVKNNIKSLKSFIKEREKCSELIGETIYENARLTAIDLVGENE
jgi:replicative superfamily II helicase